jgi:hypothetical protein
MPTLPFGLNTLTRKRAAVAEAEAEVRAALLAHLLLVLRAR